MERSILESHYAEQRNQKDTWDGVLYTFILLLRK